MSSHLALKCIASVATPPVSLTRREEGSFYCHIAVPISDQLVVFSEGDWEEEGREYEVNLRYKDDEINLGKITSGNRCLLWKQIDMMVPPLMLSETEKGLAKLVVDICEYIAPPPQPIPVATFDLDLITTNENTPQFFDEKKSTPDRPQKKRRNSLNKEDITPSGPTNKKQKTTTRMRKTTPKTAKPDKKVKDSDEAKVASAKTQKDSPKPQSADRKIKKNAESKTAKPDKKIKDSNGAKVTSPRDKKDSPKPQSADRKTKKNAENKSSPKVGKKEKDSPKGTRKKSTQSNANSSDVGEKQPSDKVSGNENVDAKDRSKDDVQSVTETKDTSKHARRKSEPRKKSEVLGVLGDKIVENQENKCVRKNRQTDKASSTNTVESDLVTQKSDKENIDFDIVNTEKKDGMEGVHKLKNSNIDLPEERGKMASCKDITLRALERPSGRWGHSLCFIHKKQSVLIGGQGEKSQLCKDSVWTLDTETRRWLDMVTESESQKPEYRMGHTATYDPIVRCIYVFGGSKNTRWFHDVHMLDIEEWKWQLLKVNGKAPTRAYHSATLYRHELWIFGGVYPRPDPQPDGCSNEIQIFSPVMESWYSPIVSGEKPIPRSGHSATLLNDQLVVFGGWDAPISYSDLHILDMSIVEWTQPKVSGSPPSPRSWHASCALSNNRVMIHGGYNGDFALEDTHIFNLDALCWSQIVVDSPPSARVGHKALCMPYRIDNGEEDEVIIFGGGDNDGAYFDDLYSMYIPFSAGIESKDSEMCTS
ncbi:uncharacterized protein LOC128209997 [Mya arenaria]|uniref:uncharacterized protein LOC128209997 n=1 Tax=Mya arenaria TaxID=6604 RepID=UPI0022E81875|nr:uncharacterized protein LOC128209997 [Mya arenaria]